MRGLAVMNDDAEEGEGVNDPRTNRKPNAFKDNITDALYSEPAGRNTVGLRRSYGVSYKAHSIGQLAGGGRAQA